MLVESKEVVYCLRKLVAEEGKIIVSKQLDEDGKPAIEAKVVYLTGNDSPDNYEEIEIEAE